MQRERGGLVPIGEAFDGLGGPVQALRAAPPPLQRGFTLADQVNQLVSANEADPDRLSWRQVYRQFGVDPAKASDKRTVDAFRTKCLRELKKIKLAWPELNYSTAPGLLILHPSTPAIAPLNQGQLGR